MKSFPSLTTLRKPTLKQTMYVLTGHGPFCSHLAKLRLVDDPSCPNCGSPEYTSMHFLLNCPKFHSIRKWHLTALCKLPNHRPANTNLPNHCINICDLVDYVRLSDRFKITDARSNLFRGAIEFRGC